MAKCKACGETYPEGSRFCAHCGASLADDNAVIADALQAAQKDFDRDSMATLDKSRITYVCSICGSINRIDQDKCTRCGKPRPRNEYVNALKRINASKEMNAQSETLVAPLPVQAEPVQVVEEPVVQEPIAQPEPVQEVVNQVAPSVMPVGGQAGAITQPFVVVPYVDSMYPLRQYNPNQLYRYQPYTPEELAAIKAQREAEELKARLAVQEQAVAQEGSQEVCENNVCDAKRVKKFAGWTLFLSIIMAACAGFIAYLVVGNGFDFAGLELFGYIRLAGVAVMVITALAAIIHSIVRLASGNAKCRGWIIGLLYIIAAVAFAIGTIFAGGKAFAFDAIVAYVTDLINTNIIKFIGGVVAVVVAFIHLVVTAASPRARKQYYFVGALVYAMRADNIINITQETIMREKNDKNVLTQSDVSTPYFKHFIEAQEERAEREANRSPLARSPYFEQGYEKEELALKSKKVRKSKVKRQRTKGTMKRARRGFMVFLVLFFSLLYVAVGALSFLQLDALADYNEYFDLFQKVESVDGGLEGTFTDDGVSLEFNIQGVSLKDIVMSFVKSFVPDLEGDYVFYDECLSMVDTMDTVNKIAYYVLPVAIMLSIVIAFVLFVRALVSLCTTKRRKLFVLSSVLMLVLTLISILCGFVWSGMEFAYAIDFINVLVPSAPLQVGYGSLIMTALSLLATIASLFAFRGKKKVK